MAGSTLILSGEVDGANAMELAQWLMEQGGLARLDLSGLEVAGAAAVVHLVNGVRALAERRAQLCVVAAPHLLAHNLYRCGLLLDGRIVLEGPREELPYG